MEKVWRLQKQPPDRKHKVSKNILKPKFSVIIIPSETTNLGWVKRCATLGPN